MRTNSPKQTVASRANGAKSKGPKSSAGKNKAAENSLRDGAFSRQVVIEQLGESQTEFEGFKKVVWELLQPSNIVEEMLVADFIENWWRRERIRRAEANELRNRMAVLDFQSDLRREDEVEILQSRFLVLYENYVTNQGRSDATNLISELENTRLQLASTGSGVDFLIRKLEYLKEIAEKEGVLSPEDVALLRACSGFGSDETKMVIAANLMNKRESSKGSKNSAPSGTPAEEAASARQVAESEILQALKRILRNQQGKINTDESRGSTETSASDKSTGTGETAKSPEQTKGEYSPMLVLMISMAIQALRTRKQILPFIAAAEKQRFNSMAIIDQDSSDRFSRAETAVERRMYRALTLLAAIRTSVSLPLLPDPKGSE